MRAIVLSDSHNDTSSCERAINASGKLDLIIHLGDIARDVDYLEAYYYPIKVVSVLGNNDLSMAGLYAVTHSASEELENYARLVSWGELCGPFQPPSFLFFSLSSQSVCIEQNFSTF